MKGQSADILVAGGGVAGLIAACAFGAAGFSVVCVDPVAPVTDGAAADADQRSTAFLQPSVALLARAGLWARLAPHAAPLRVMRIIDDGGPPARPRIEHAFDARDIGADAFGYNLPNWVLRRELVARLAQLPGVVFRPGVAVTGVLARDAAMLVTLSDGPRIAARLLVAADGRQSPIRAALGIGVQQMRYGQKALSFSVTHPLPHDNVTTEIHRSGGPFTLVPLQTVGGLHASAVVWMERGAEIARLAALDETAFAAALADRSCGLLGPLTPASPRAVWPIIGQIADRFDGPRTALIAEAAHVVPPIGAQGLNMSLADIAALLDLAAAAEAAGQDGLGGTGMLAAYHRRRRPDARLRLAGIDLLNRASMARAQGLRALRADALDALYRLEPVRHALMRRGMGTDPGVAQQPARSD